MIEIGRRGLIAGVGAAYAGAAFGAAKPAVVTVGQAAPPFDVFTFDFKKVHFAEMRGQVVMLNFWATWCAPCRQELPRLDAYYRRHAAEGLRVFAVKSDDAMPNEALTTLTKSLAVTLVWHLDTKSYGTIGGALPTNYVIDRTGVVRYAEAGAFETAGLEEVVTPLLKETAPAPASVA
jgi:cytochrome c biogenesis protein CcmG, thiol:disulfide interchange protein DsbE